jgi:hypothetical protein
MEGFTYAQLVEALQNWPDEEGTDTDYYADIPRLISLGELRLVRELNLELQDYEDTGMTATTDDRVVAKADGMLSIRDAFLILDSGERVPLLLRSYAYIQNFNPNPETTGRPRFYCEFDESSILVAPTPDADYGVGARGVKRPDGLTETNPTTWLATHFGDLLFACCLMEAEHWLKADDRYADIKGKHDELIPVARAEARNLIRAGDYSPYKGSAKEA